MNQTIIVDGHRWPVAFMPVKGKSDDERGWLAITAGRPTPEGRLRPWRRNLLEKLFRKHVARESVHAKGRTPEEALNWLRHELCQRAQP